MLALVGGIAGVILAYVGVDVLVAMSAGTIPEPEQIRFDGRLAGFAVAVTAITGVIFGLFPAWQAARIQPQVMLKDGAASGQRGRFGLQNILVVAEMALAVILVSGAGLMIKSFYQLVRVDPGFEVENVLNEHSAIAECACVGVPDTGGLSGEAVMAFVVSNGDERPSERELTRFLRDRLEPYKCPVKYAWVDEIPKTSSGKLQRQILNLVSGKS